MGQSILSRLDRLVDDSKNATPRNNNNIPSTMIKMNKYQNERI